ncbi:unnamed protein product [Larinioides sclopetarius]|uniref:TIL domain-containing protein n=1 Tax=Larinioides sclopetarius TaxID=280406 RepID=A0AAV2A262_9ARAC
MFDFKQFSPWAFRNMPNANILFYMQMIKMRKNIYLLCVLTASVFLSSASPLSNKRDCPENSFYIECYKDCMPTCFEKRPPLCPLECRRGGCACRRPYIYDEQARTCVRPEDCIFGP